MHVVILRHWLQNLTADAAHVHAGTDNSPHASADARANTGAHTSTHSSPYTITYQRAWLSLLLGFLMYSLVRIF